MNKSSYLLSFALLSLSVAGCDLSTSGSAGKSIVNINEDMDRSTFIFAQDNRPTDLSCVPSGGLAELDATGIDLSLGIVNGVVTDNYASVVMLRTTEFVCSGTAVSDSTVITARHCLDSGRSNGDLSYNKIDAVAALASTDLDVAVVVFPENTFASHARLLDRAPRVGDALMLVGYGQYDVIRERNDHRKRVGCNTLNLFADKSGLSISHRSDAGDYIHYRGPIDKPSARGRESMTGKGDSGGPSFIEGKLAGVVSFGSTRTDLVDSGFQLINDAHPTLDANYTYDVNLWTPKAREFLKRAETRINARITGL